MFSEDVHVVIWDGDNFCKFLAEAQVHIITRGFAISMSASAKLWKIFRILKKLLSITFNLLVFSDLNQVMINDVMIKSVKSWQFWKNLESKCLFFSAIVKTVSNCVSITCQFSFNQCSMDFQLIVNKVSICLQLLVNYCWSKFQLFTNWFSIIFPIAYSMANGLSSIQ